MALAIVTGSGGLVGAATTRLFAAEGMDVLGIDNDMRRVFFGPAASTAWQVTALRQGCRRYTHVDADIRDTEAVSKVFARYGREVAAVVHCAAQPSHDWAMRDPVTDFTVNANGTLTLLEATRQHAPEAAFIFVSTNKVYGDRPNALPLVEQATRFELDPAHPWAKHGIPEDMPVDACLHSLFGASKLAADVLVQEYGRYFGMRTACFRGGCLTGPGHSGAQLHGFLSYLVRCAASGTPYTVFGHKAKQVRDNIHADDLARAFLCFVGRPTSGDVYNIGGGRHSNCSVVEAVALAEAATGRAMHVSVVDQPRIGDHVWWISDTRKFRAHYPDWRPRHDIASIVADIHAGVAARTLVAAE